MGLPVLSSDVMDVVGGCQGESQLVSKAKLICPDGLLIVKAVILQFDVKVSFSEYIPESNGFRLCSLVIPVKEHSLHVSRKACAEADEPFAVSPENVLVDTRLVVISFRISYGYYLDQVLVTLFVFCKQNQMPLAFVAVSIFIQMTSGGGVNLAADDGLYSLSLAFFVEVHDSEHGSVIGDGQACHTQFLCPGYHVLYAGCSVQKTVFSM